jgi:CDP-diacylglycerol---glycerol-3-phosphate 3-phosphatidyltransferase
MANVITLLRMPLLALVVWLLYQPTAGHRFVAAGLIVVLILLDTLDGVVARALHQESLIGSILDIAADRTVELVLWVVFADLDLIPIVVPLVVLARGVFVDAVRSVAPAQGLTPFGLMRSRFGRFLVKSPWLRTPYGLVKAVAFCLLALRHGLAVSTGAVATTGMPQAVGLAALVATWTALALCIVRGLPVLIEGTRVLRQMSGAERHKA